MDYFKPWVGQKYNKKNIFSNKNVMILAESLYGFEEVKNAGEVAINIVVQQYLDNINMGIGHRDRIFTTLAKICLNKTELNKEETNEFWQSIVYYNYITESLIKPGDRPTEEQFEKGRKPFLKILAKYEPQYVLVCGKQLWFSIPESIGHKGPENYFWYFPVNDNKEAISTYIYHPSRYTRGFDGRDSRKLFKKLLSY